MDLDILLDGVLAGVVPLMAAIAVFILKTWVDATTSKTQEKEIKDEVDRFIDIIDQGDKDVISLMIKNVAELREYYVINKQQARNSFSAALFMSVLGFALFAAGIGLSYAYKADNIIQYATIGGAIVEIIAGLFFWLYSKAIAQINLFHGSLLKTEKFLTAIQLVEKVSEANKDKVYTFIINKVISSDNNSTLSLENETVEK